MPKTPLKLRKVGDHANRRFSLLEYGDPGVGKTSTLAQCGFMLKPLPDGTPDWSRLVFINGEEGHASISHLSGVSEWKPFVDGKPNDILRALEDNPDAYDVVFIDGLGTIMRETYDEFKVANEASQHPNPMQVWGKYGESMLLWVSRMSRLPANVILTTHTQVDEDPNSKVRFKPETRGGRILSPEVLLGLFDYVTFLRWYRIDPAKPPVRSFLTSQDAKRGGDPRYAVKFRVPLDRDPLPANIYADPKDAPDGKGGIRLLWDTLYPDAPDPDSDPKAGKKSEETA